MLKRPFLLIAVSALTGLWLYMLFPAALPFIGGALLLAPPVFALKKRPALCKTALICAVAFCVAVSDLHIRDACTDAPVRTLCGGRYEVSGELVKKTQTAAGDVSVVLKKLTVDSLPCAGRLQATCALPESAAPGDTVTLNNCYLFDADEGDLFYYHRRSSGILLRGSANTAYVQPRTDQADLPLMLLKSADAVNRRLHDVLPAESAAVTAALLTGDRDGLSDTFTSALRVSGGSHLFAVSGMHLNLWIGLLFLLLGRRARTKRAANALAIALTVFYAAFTGFSPSVLRAGLMTFVLLLGRMLRRRQDALNALGLAASVLLFANPALAGNVSFLLSSFSSAAIAWLFIRFEKKTDKRTPLFPKYFLSARNLLLLGLCVLLFTVPVTGIFFGACSLLSPVTGLTCALSVSLVMSTGLGALLFGRLPVPGSLFVFINEKNCVFLTSVIRSLGSIRGAMLPIDLKAAAVWYLITAAALLILYLIKKKRLLLPALLTSVSLLLCGLLVRQAVCRDRLDIRLYDAGSAVVLSVKAGCGESAVLIGTGEDYAAASAVSDDLNRSTAHTLDCLILPAASKAEYACAYRYLCGFSVLQICKTDGVPQPENAAGIATVSGDRFTVSPVRGVTYRSLCCDGADAGLLTAGGTRYLLVYTAGSDLTALQAADTAADVLICRGGLPKGVRLSDHREIIVCTDKSAAELHLPPGVRTTGDAGAFNWTLSAG
ncbi:MAG: ComEC/Rec2 family competence protein [Clostridia bacterium]|nr:ComEC/Rec2 family competence protein [Clostridia bacterium]